MHTLIGVPMLGAIDPSVVVSLMQVAAETRVHSEVTLCHTEGLVPHDKGRERTFKAAVEADADYILCLDADMTFPPGTFKSLLDALQDHEAQVASGMYVRRGPPYTPVWSAKVGGGWRQVTAETGVHEIHMTGLGCALIDMRWLREHVKPPFCTYQRRYDRPDVLDDETLFDNIREAGGKMVGVADVSCGHLLRPEIVTNSNAHAYRARAIGA